MENVLSKDGEETGVADGSCRHTRRYKIQESLIKVEFSTMNFSSCELVFQHIPARTKLVVSPEAIETCPTQAGL